MERQGRRRDAHRFGDGSGAHALGTPFHQHPEDGEARFLDKGSEGLNGVYNFHISVIVKTMKKGKPREQREGPHGAWWQASKAALPIINKVSTA